MAYTISDLNPARPVLIIDSQEISISLITLNISLYIEQEFTTLENLLKELDKNKVLIFKIVWMLVLDKKEFNNNFVTFSNKIQSKESLLNVAKKLTAVLYEAIKKSQPLVKNLQRQKDAQRIQQTQTEKEPCFADYFDTIAARYGHTLEDFYNLTLRNLHIILKTVGDKKYEELEIQAALLDKKLKPRLNIKEISEEEEQANEDQAQEALKELQRKYQENKDK